MKTIDTMLPLWNFACLVLSLAVSNIKIAASAYELPVTQDQQPLIIPSPESFETLFDSGRSGLLYTFANLPYANCFKGDPEIQYDIAILGAPFDTVGAGYSG